MQQVLPNITPFSPVADSPARVNDAYNNVLTCLLSSTTSVHWVVGVIVTGLVMLTVSPPSAVTKKLPPSRASVNRRSNTCPHRPSESTVGRIWKAFNLEPHQVDIFKLFDVGADLSTPVKASENGSTAADGDGKQDAITPLRITHDYVDLLTVKYFNRLSDLLFILSRVASTDSHGGTGDILWGPGGEHGERDSPKGTVPPLDPDNRKTEW